MGFFDVLFPPRCPFCSSVIPSSSKGICDDCLSSLPFVGSKHVCRICGVDIDCCECHKRSFPCTRRTAPLYYDGLAKRGVIRFKKYGRFGGVETLARLVADRVLSEYSDVRFDLIVCVPSSKTSLRERGYNQTDLLAKHISRFLGIPVNCGALIRLYDNGPQKGMSKVARKGNVAGVFDVADPKSVCGKSVLLIDDVITTGATLNECAKMLRIFGATRVYGAAVCIVRKRSKIPQKV